MGVNPARRCTVLRSAESMKTDLIELARICLVHARASKAPKVAAALLRMAKEYQRRAALVPDGSDPAQRHRAPISDCSAAPPARPRIVGRDQVRRVSHAR